MGRLPATWAGRIINQRVPYQLYGEISMVSAQQGLQFPDATFMNSVDKPFEIHRMIPRVYSRDSGNVLLATQTAMSTLSALIKCRLMDLGLNQDLTKTPARLDAMTKGEAERTWEWADPHYLTRSNLIQVTLDADTFPSISTMTNLLVCITFQGFLLVVAPPSENR
jgi:hypothetical protein